MNEMEILWMTNEQLIKIKEEINNEYENRGLERNRRNANESNGKSMNNVSERYRDYSGLPQEILDELQKSKKHDQYAMQIREVLKDGPLDINQILIGLYKVHNRIEQRSKLAMKLSNMQQKKLIKSVSGKKGIYCLR